MHTKKSPMGKIVSVALAVIMICSVFAINAFAADKLKTGTYEVDATLSCYVNAMGGVEFSDGYGLVKGATVTVAEDGTASVTLELGTTTGLAIYTIPCTAFIGTNAAPGYYDADGNVVTDGVTYTVSEETAYSGTTKSDVAYMNSLSLPVTRDVSEYTLWLYIDSNVMGCQLGNGTGTGSSNNPGVATKHTATLTIDWEDVEIEECTCMCHSDGIMGVFWKIVNFFNKLFGTNPGCGCGAVHY